MQLDELYAPLIPERKQTDSDEKAIRYTDPELARTLAQASVKYPYYKTGQEGFMKYTQRSIKHSQEQDEEHNKKINELQAEIDSLKALLKKIVQSD